MEDDKWTLKIIQVNGSCWNTAKTVIAKTDAHLIAVQETKLADDDLIEEASSWCRKRGWQSFWGRAEKTEAGGRSSGTAVLVRLGLGALAFTETEIPPELQGRVALCRVQVPKTFDFVFGSVYCEAGSLLGRVNTNILGLLGTVATSTRLATFFAGDYNMPPSTIMATSFLGRSQSVILSPRRPTCIQGRGPHQTIDFAIVSRRLAKVVQHTKIEGQHDISPHWVVAHTFAPRPNNLKAWMVKIPEKIPIDRAWGPTNNMASIWEKLPAARAAVQAAGDIVITAPCRQARREALNTAYHHLGLLMEEDICIKTDTVLQHPGERTEPLRLVYKNILPDSKSFGATWGSAAAPLRWLKGKISEVAGLVTAVTTGGDHLKKAMAATRLTEMDQELQEERPEDGTQPSPCWSSRPGWPS